MGDVRKDDNEKAIGKDFPRKEVPYAEASCFESRFVAGF